MKLSKTGMIYSIYGEEFTPKFSLPLGGDLKSKDFTPIDLSKKNPDLHKGTTDTVEGLHNYVFGTIAAANAKCAYGGYAEKRDLYKRSGHFADMENFRSIHLGIDFWMPAGTDIIAPMPGRVHSFKNNDNPGDYGPTIILEHFIGNEIIHSLYGHLSKISLAGLIEGELINRGQKIATLGTPDENRDWPPHLHFQLIKDMGDNRGDYPGVCHKKDKKYYLENCPNPLVYFENTWRKKIGYTPTIAEPRR